MQGEAREHLLLVRVVDTHHLQQVLEKVVLLVHGVLAQLPAHDADEHAAVGVLLVLLAHRQDVVSELHCRGRVPGDADEPLVEEVADRRRVEVRLNAEADPAVAPQLGQQLLHVALADLAVADDATRAQVHRDVAAGAAAHEVPMLPHEVAFAQVFLPEPVAHGLAERLALRLALLLRQLVLEELDEVRERLLRRREGVDAEARQDLLRGLPRRPRRHVVLLAFEVGLQGLEPLHERFALGSQQVVLPRDALQSRLELQHRLARVLTRQRHVELVVARSPAVAAERATGGVFREGGGLSGGGGGAALSLVAEHCLPHDIPHRGGAADGRRQRLPGLHSRRHAPGDRGRGARELRLAAAAHRRAHRLRHAGLGLAHLLLQHRDVVVQPLVLAAHGGEALLHGDALVRELDH
mmetsp:Transcript_14784/g.45860  ORF Transcript_14784/g.45860 Transcript_14784/m.45860 type:complete len:410 (+) Transcript_14784:1103-2332(+)